jgi:two-component system, OmpR family, sensor histidine kinase ChvG
MDKLIANSIDFSTPNTSIEVSLEQHTNHFLLSVFNQGNPIPNTQINNLFNAMTSHRNKQSTQPHLGLGLYIVRLIVEFHRGSVQALNTATGVRFEIILPADLL